MPRPRSSRPARPTAWRRSHRPRVESLEDRWLPSTLAGPTLPEGDRADRDVTVMTRNLYVGTDLEAPTAWLPAVALVQPLHGLTFALGHLACMRLLALIVPPGLAATALTVYGTLGVGAATALLTLASGLLYSRLGPEGFWVMAALCAAALPLTRGLRRFSPGPLPC